MDNFTRNMLADSSYLRVRHSQVVSWGMVSVVRHLGGGCNFHQYCGSSIIPPGRIRKESSGGSLAYFTYWQGNFQGKPPGGTCCRNNQGLMKLTKDIPLFTFTTSATTNPSVKSGMIPNLEKRVVLPNKDVKLWQRFNSWCFPIFTASWMLTCWENHQQSGVFWAYIQLSKQLWKWHRQALLNGQLMEK